MLLVSSDPDFKSLTEIYSFEVENCYLPQTFYSGRKSLCKTARDQPNSLLLSKKQRYNMHKDSSDTRDKILDRKTGDF